MNFLIILRHRLAKIGFILYFSSKVVSTCGCFFIPRAKKGTSYAAGKNIGEFARIYCKNPVNMVNCLQHQKQE
jgi:hypothetical protein